MLLCCDRRLFALLWKSVGSLELPVISSHCRQVFQGPKQSGSVHPGRIRLLKLQEHLPGLLHFTDVPWGILWRISCKWGKSRFPTDRGASLQVGKAHVGSGTEARDLGSPQCPMSPHCDPGNPLFPCWGSHQVLH